MLRSMILMLAFVVAACASPTAPTVDYEVAGAAPLDPPAWYAEVHAELVACAGTSEPFEGVRWFLADRIEATGMPVVAGLWLPGDTIYLAQPWDEDPRVVRHELLHHLLQRGNEIHGGAIMARCAPWWG